MIKQLCIDTFLQSLDVRQANFICLYSTHMSLVKSTLNVQYNNVTLKITCMGRRLVLIKNGQAFQLDFYRCMCSNTLPLSRK